MITEIKMKEEVRDRVDVLLSTLKEDKDRLNSTLSELCKYLLLDEDVLFSKLSNYKNDRVSTSKIEGFIYENIFQFAIKRAEMVRQKEEEKARESLLNRLNLTDEEMELLFPEQ